MRTIRGAGPPAGRRVWNANLHYHDLILDAIPAGSSRVLDVGCGDGILCAELARAGLREVVGLDRDSLALERASAWHRGVRWLHGDLFETSLEPESFDAVVSVAALHHMDAAAALTRFAELVRPGGAVVVIGLAANDWWDWPYACVAYISTSTLGVLYGKWEHSAPTVWPPPLSYRDVKQLARRLLPNVQYRRLLLGRFSLVWRKPQNPWPGCHEPQD